MEAPLEGQVFVVEDQQAEEAGEVEPPMEPVPARFVGGHGGKQLLVDQFNHFYVKNTKDRHNPAKFHYRFWISNIINNCKTVSGVRSRGTPTSNALGLRSPRRRWTAGFGSSKPTTSTTMLLTSTR